MSHITVPIDLLRRASESLGSFVSDHGWSQADMDVMDSIDALLAAPAPAQPAAVLWSGLTEGERNQAVHSICEYGAGFVAPLFAVIEGVERVLERRNASPPPPAPAQAVPLTEAQLEVGRDQIFVTANPFCPCTSQTFRKVARWVEKKHGIAGEQHARKV